MSETKRRLPIVIIISGVLLLAIVALLLSNNPPAETIKDTISSIISRSTGSTYAYDGKDPIGEIEPRTMIRLKDGTELKKAEYKVSNLSKTTQFIKHIDNKSLYIVEGNKTAFQVDTTAPIEYVGDVEKTKEWGSKVARGWNTETLTSSQYTLVGRDNVTHHIVCLWETCKGNLGKKQCKCTTYPKQFSLNGTLLSKHFETSNAHIIKMFDAYDPTYDNVNVSDYRLWYNLSKIVDGKWPDSTKQYNMTASNSKNISSATYCVGNRSCFYWGEPLAGNAAYDSSKIFTNKSGTIAVQITLNKTETNGWGSYGGFYSSNELEIRSDSGSNIACSVHESDGWITKTILASGDINLSQHFVFFCMFNSTHVCWLYDNHTKSCSADRNAPLSSNTSWIGLGRDLDTANYFSSGIVYYDRALNQSEVYEVYNCLSNGRNIDEGCTLEDEANNAPVISNAYPANNSVNNSVPTILWFNYTDADAEDGTCTIIEGNGTVRCRNASISSGANTTCQWATSSERTYNFTINCTDGTNMSTTTSYFFTAADVIAPTMQLIDVYNYTNQTARIDWACSGDNCNGTVNYGTTTALGSFGYDTAYEGEKSVTLTGLSNNTFYYYNVTSCDSARNCNTNGTYNFTTHNNPPNGGTGSKVVILNLTFDDSSKPWKDYSTFNSSVTNQGSVFWENQSFCKYYGCANLSNITGGSGDYDFLNLSSPINITKGLSSCFWTYLLSEPDNGADAIYYWGIGVGNTGEQKLLTETGYGLNNWIDASTGRTDATGGSGYNTQPDEWTHWCTSYDGIRLIYWKDGTIITNSSEPFGDINYTWPEQIWIGLGSTNTDMDGYFDEFVMWNGSLSDAEVQDIYDRQREGTPPEVDIYVKAIKYRLPYNWSDQWNRITRGSVMPINITLSNYGLNDSGVFSWNITLQSLTTDNGSGEWVSTGRSIAICNNTLNLSSKTDRTYHCNWTTEYGFHQGYLMIDISDDVSVNDLQRVYIPFVDRPYMYYTQTEWNNTLKDFCLNASNVPANNICTRYTPASTSDDFTSGLTGNDVDPKGKKGRQNAMRCMYYDFNTSLQSCNRTRRHFFGWANRTVSTYSNVQAIHYLSEVGGLIDAYFPAINATDYNKVAEGYYRICNHITNLANTKPYNDNRDLIDGGNGWGFGSGMGLYCYATIGLYPENPCLINNRTDQYWGESIADEWMGREIAYLRAYKNDSWALYQEGMGYKGYSQNHLAEVFYYEDRFDLGYDDLDNYRNAFCSMTRELATQVLDDTYNGNTLRNGLNVKKRVVSRGDGNSYDDVGENEGVEWTLIEHFAYLCQDSAVVNYSMWLREWSVNTSDYDATWALQDQYINYRLTSLNGQKQSPDLTMDRAIIDNANDIFLIRDHYTYDNDTLFIVDGGEERGGGHSQAQGYFLYALGEPFFDYEQTPFNDDLRIDVWKNVPSMRNMSQTGEGQGGQWKDEVGEYAYNQYYGNDRSAYYSLNGTDYRTFPLAYGGDLEDYVGTNDAKFGGVYVWRPYFNITEPVKEWFIKFGDVIVKRTKVSTSNEEEVFHPFIHVAREFNLTVSGSNFTMNRNETNKNLVTRLIYSNETTGLRNAATNVSLCFAKTSCTGGSKGSSNYGRPYYYVNNPSVDMIFAHHWYLSGQEQAIHKIDNADKGLNMSNNIVLFDNDDDGDIIYNSVNASGWGLVFNNQTGEVGAFNTTSINIGSMNLFVANDSISVHLKRNTTKIVLTANTYKRRNFIDFPKNVNVTIDAQELTNEGNYTVKKNGVTDVTVASESGSLVTFTISTEQNSDYFEITSGGFPDMTVEMTSITNISQNMTWLNVSVTCTNCTYYNFTLNGKEYYNGTLPWYNFTGLAPGIHYSVNVWGHYNSTFYDNISEIYETFPNLCSAGGSTNLNDDIYLYYTFDSSETNATHTYDQFYSRDGLISDARANATGVADEAFAYSDQDSINTTFMRINSTYWTFSFWFNTTTNTEMIPFDMRNLVNTYSCYVYLNNGADGRITIPCRTGGASNDDWTYTNDGIDYTNGTWFMLTVRRNGEADTAVDIFINGVNVSTLVNPHEGAQSNIISYERTAIGKYTLNGNYDFVGNIDEFGFWNRSLTDAEILELYGSGSPKKPSGGAFSGGSGVSCNYTVDVTSIFNQSQTGDRILVNWTETGDGTHCILRDCNGTLLLNTTFFGYSHVNLTANTQYCYNVTCYYNATKSDFMNDTFKTNSLPGNYTTTFSINCSKTLTQPFQINYTDGVVGCGDRLKIWTRCYGAGMKIVCNSSTIFSVQNSSGPVPWDCDNCTDNSPSTVWTDSGARTVYTFDSNSTITDSAGYSNGVNNGASSVPGAFGRAVDFNRAEQDFINFSYSNMTVNTTYLFWIKTTDVEPSRSIFESADGADERVAMWYHSPEGAAGADNNSWIQTAHYKDAAHQTSQHIDLRTNGHGFANDSWHMIGYKVASKTGKSGFFYDGHPVPVTLDVHNDSNTGPVNLNHDFIIGATYIPWINGTNRYGDFELDEFRHYTIYLSWAEVNVTYQNYMGTEGYGNIISGLDTNSPDMISGLKARFITNDSIYWNWTNPVDADFSANVVYLDGVWQQNSSDNFYNATGLTNHTNYTITVRTVDTSGNLNTTNVTMTNQTLQDPDQRPPAIISGISAQTITNDSIYWNWTNPVDADFSANVVYLDGAWQQNSSDNFYNATGLTNHTNYTITVRTVDTSGNLNTTNVTLTNMTLDNPDQRPPATITDLFAQIITSDRIMWNWTNPSDSDFLANIVYLDGVWQQNSSDNFFNATGLAENTNYTITVRTVDTSGNVNTTNVTMTNRTLTDCVNNLTYTGWSSWNNLTGCRINNTILQNRSRLLYDANQCGNFTSITEWEWNNLVCNYCSMNVTYGNWTPIANTSCEGRDYWDSNWLYCCFLTNISSDCLHNDTDLHNLTYVEINCTPCVNNLTNTTWSAWQNMSACINGTVLQNRSYTVYDFNNCGNFTNITYWDYRNASCGNCSNSITNITFSWINYTCNESDLIPQNRTILFYDANKCGNYSNWTYVQNRSASCNFCSYSLNYSAWSAWSNSTCGVRNRSVWDDNWINCCAVTGLSADCYRNDSLVQNFTYWLNETKVCISSNCCPISWLPMTMILVFMTGFMALAAFLVHSKALMNLKVLFFLLFVVNLLSLPIIMVIMTYNPIDITTYQPIALGYFSVNMLALIYFLYVYALHLVTNIFKKSDEEENG